MRTTIAIVGGGLSGLHAARLLLQAGLAFELVEARDRLGGRILSVNGGGDPAADGFDLGPSWFWPGMHPRMARIVDALGLRSFAQHAEGDALFERPGLAAALRFPTMRQEPPSMRLAGGTGALVAALAAGLPARHLHLGARLTGVALHQGLLRLTIDRGGAGSELVADHVILALPPRLAAATVAFAPALDEATLLRWRETATWMAPHAKFLAIYDRPFWRQAGLSGTAQSSLGPMVEIHDASLPSGAAALFGFLGLDRRQRLALGEAAITRACVGQFVRLFGPEAGQPHATLFKDWAADPLTATAADEQPGGHPAADPRPWVTGAWAQGLSLAGSETSATDPGYLAGALDAAERAVAETILRLKG